MLSSSSKLISYLGSKLLLILPVIIDWLKKHDIPYDEIHVAKPWCGNDGFYIDDKSIRPSEFAQLSYEEIQQLLAKEK
jgi:capsule biosynthesis phosphatase